MHSFPLARTQRAHKLCSRESHSQRLLFTRTPSQELQSPRQRRRKTPKTRQLPQVVGWPLVRSLFSLRDELADWLGAHSPLPPRSSAPIRKTRSSAGTCSIAETHAGYALGTACGFLQVTRTSEALAAACITHIATYTTFDVIKSLFLVQITLLLNYVI